MKLYIYILLLLSVVSTSCSDYLDIEPVGKVIPKSVSEYRSFLTTAYSIPHNHKVLTTYRTDELVLSPKSRGVELYRDIYLWNDKNPDPQASAFSYASFYKIIFHANEIINNAASITGDPEMIKQLVGEAYALRAWQYFELVNLYGTPYDKNTSRDDSGVPIVTEYDSEAEYPKQNVQKVYDLILSDIGEAEKLLQVEQHPIGNNYRFSMTSVKCLKAKVLMYQKEWQQAIDVIDTALTMQSVLLDLNVSRSKMPSEYDSEESILALDIVSSYDIANNATVSEGLIEAYDKDNDLRFVMYYNPQSDGTYRAVKNADKKYKCSFRTSDLYLYKIEALAMLDKMQTSKDLLGKFSKYRYNAEGWQAYQAKISTLDRNELIQEILEERRREFAIEGHRWNDLRRTTQQSITKTFDGKEYILTENDTRYTVPFPREAVVNNPLLGIK